MKRTDKEYLNYVEHPRYGRFPNYTGLNPNLFAKDAKRIPNTAILADLSRQTPATVPVTHYFDLERICRDCGRPFIFFAEEQKHWYEELGFGLESDCVRCVECRKRQRGIARKHERYEELFHTPNRTAAENLEMAECCLSLIESSTFTRRQLERVRMLLNSTRSQCDDAPNAEHSQLLARVRSLESQDDEHSHAPEPASGRDSSGESSPPAQ